MINKRFSGSEFYFQNDGTGEEMRSDEECRSEGFAQHESQGSNAKNTECGRYESFWSPGAAWSGEARCIH